jgi:hypothetical protein
LRSCFQTAASTGEPAGGLAALEVFSGDGLVTPLPSRLSIAVHADQASALRAFDLVDD